MRKRFILILGGVGLLVVLAIYLIPAFSEWQLSRRLKQPLGDEELTRSAAELRGVAPASAPPIVPAISLDRSLRLAIGNLNLADVESEMRLGDLILANLTSVAGLDLVERRELELAFREAKMSAAGLLRAKDAIVVGKLLRADWFLLGSTTRLNETNYMVARIVDARTGVLCEAAFFLRDQTPVRLASELANFINQSRQRAARAESPIFLSVGAFGNIGVNSRQADFPEQLRAYLLAAYQKSSVTMLEREFAETLLKEVYLDLAGLTDETSATGVAMQSAYWMVDGSYQSYESAIHEVELELNIQRMFGKSQQLLLRDKPGEPLFKRIKEGIDLIMQQNAAALTPTRVTEIRSRMLNGKELARLAYVDVVFGARSPGMDNSAAVKQRQNAEEAIRVFQTVLLLSPTNREARMYLAACWRTPSIYRNREAHDLYRELLDENVQDKWVGQAQRALVWSLGFSSAEDRARWFAAACQQGSNSPSANFYCQNATKAAQEVILERDGGDAVVGLAEERLREAVQSTKIAMEGKGGDWNIGMNEFCNAFKGNKAAAAEALARFLPTLQTEFPSLAPHLVAEALGFQTDTNTPLVAGYFTQMDWCLENPQAVSGGMRFWDSSRFSAYGWFMHHKLFEAAVRTMEAYQLAAERKDAIQLRFEERDRIALAYAYMGVERWQDALVIFESLTNQSVTMHRDGPWGRAYDPVLSGQHAALCRKKLGLLAKNEPVEQELEKQILCLHAPSDFLADKEALWVAIGDVLLNLSFELTTNLAIKLPGHVEVACLAKGGGKLWVGTRGDGLIEVDPVSKECRLWTEADGLLMNYISALHYSADQLWIGYGTEAGGGLGSIALRTGKITAYMPSLLGSGLAPGAQATPPRTSVSSIASGQPGMLWMLARGESGPRRFRISEGVWDVVPTKGGEIISCFALGDGQILAGAQVTHLAIDVEFKTNGVTGTNWGNKRTIALTYEEFTKLRAELRTNRNQRITREAVSGIPKGSVSSLNLADHSWNTIGTAGGLPSPPSAMALAGGQLWVGGEAYLAKVDLAQKQIRKIYEVQARTVDRIHIGGGYIWVKYDKHLHRIRVNAAD